MLIVFSNANGNALSYIITQISTIDPVHQVDQTGLIADSIRGGGTVTEASKLTGGRPGSCRGPGDVAGWLGGGVVCLTPSQAAIWCFRCSPEIRR